MKGIRTDRVPGIQRSSSSGGRGRRRGRGIAMGECMGKEGDLEMELEGGGGRRRGVVSVVGSVARME